jgi:hypothetical protein
MPAVTALGCNAEGHQISRLCREAGAESAIEQTGNWLADNLLPTRIHPTLEQLHVRS